MRYRGHPVASAVLAALVASGGCALDDSIDQECNDGLCDEAHEHEDLSYQVIFDPIVAKLAASGQFGAAIADGYELITELAKDDFARHACVDSPDLWGLEIAFGGDIGVGYRQGLEVAFEGDTIALNCLNQLEVHPSASLSSQVNLIRHFGECHGPDGPIEETLFLEIGAGVSLPTPVHAGIGLAYTAGLRDGLVNRAVPEFLRGSFDNFLDVADRLRQGAPIFAPPRDAQEHETLCAEISDFFADGQNHIPAGAGPQAAFSGRFLADYIELNSDCPGAAQAISADEHDEDEHGDWTICDDVTIKSGAAWLRTRVAERRERAQGVLDAAALGQLEVMLALIDDVFSGCDHLEFQFNAGVGATTPAHAHLAFESHNYYGHIEFDGTEEELGAHLAQTFDAAADATQSCSAPWWVDWVPFLDEATFCGVWRIVRGSYEFARRIGANRHFTFHTADHFEWFGLSLPLPRDPLSNYMLTCSLGPVRNLTDFIWATD